MPNSWAWAVAEAPDLRQESWDVLEEKAGLFAFFFRTKGVDSEPRCEQGRHVLLGFWLLALALATPHQLLLFRNEWVGSVSNFVSEMSLYPPASWATKFKLENRLNS